MFNSYIFILSFCVCKIIATKSIILLSLHQSSSISFTVQVIVTHYLNYVTWLFSVFSSMVYDKNNVYNVVMSQNNQGKHCWLQIRTQKHFHFHTRKEWWSKVTVVGEWWFSFLQQKFLTLSYIYFSTVSFIIKNF